MYKSIHNASAYGNEEDVQGFLDKGVSLEAKDDSFDSGTPLLRAAYTGNIAIVDFLLAKGANPNSFNENGYTPLMAASNEGRERVVESLLRMKADAGMKTTNQGYSALHMAVDQCQSVRLITLLLESVNNVNDQSNFGSTPLKICAFRNGKNAREVIELLLSYGADKTLTNGRGETAFDDAKKHGAEHLYELLSLPD